MRSGVHEDDKRVIKSGRQSRSERGGEASEGVVGYMDVEGGNRGKAMSIRACCREVKIPNQYGLVIL